MQRPIKIHPCLADGVRGKYSLDPRCNYKMLCNVGDVSQFSISWLFIHHSALQVMSGVDRNFLLNWGQGWGVSAIPSDTAILSNCILS